MNNTKKESLTFGALLLGLVAILVGLWLLKFILGFFLVLAESLIIVFIYGVVTYFCIAVLFMLYERLAKGKVPAFVKAFLKFHKSLAGALESVYDSFRGKRKKS
ncbi:MAG: hypothetical protein NE330_22915 [Lentisphaeraceae bacterium]|nr:hypothetical protein [Lentisphaeraceae bacterium]